MTYFWFWRWDDWIFFNGSFGDESMWLMSAASSSSDPCKCVIQDHALSACSMPVIACNGSHSAWLLCLSAKLCGLEISTLAFLPPLRLSCNLEFYGLLFKFSLFILCQNLKILLLLILLFLPFIVRRFYSQHIFYTSKYVLNAASQKP